MNAMKTKKEIHTNERYKKSNQIYKIQCSMTVNKRHSIVTKLSKISCIQSKKVQDNNNTFKNPLLFLCEQVDFFFKV